jgi:hypothetical protein
MRLSTLKLSLCLTKPHTMKTYLLLNQATRRRDTLRSEVIAPHILNFGTRRRYPLYRRMRGPQSRSGRGDEEIKIPLLLLPRIERRSYRP